jgi:hypothetical protein
MGDNYGAKNAINTVYSIRGLSTKLHPTDIILRATRGSVLRPTGDGPLTTKFQMVCPGARKKKLRRGMRTHILGLDI